MKRFVFITGSFLVFNQSKPLLCPTRVMRLDLPRKAGRLHYGRRVKAVTKYTTPLGEICGPVETRLRLYRKYSIKLMLAWGTVKLEMTPFPSTNMIS